MPQVLRDGPYRLFFFSNEGDEPPHVHIQRDTALAKFWLDPLELAGSSGFAAHELTRLHRLVETHADIIRKRWHEFFSH